MESYSDSDDDGLEIGMEMVYNLDSVARWRSSTSSGMGRTQR